MISENWRRSWQDCNESNGTSWAISIKIPNVDLNELINLTDQTWESNLEREPVDSFLMPFSNHAYSYLFSFVVPYRRIPKPPKDAVACSGAVIS